MSFSGEQHRPGMRRKSSAQNLLSSFKSPPNSSAPQPSAQPLTVSSSAAAAYTGPAGAPTPVSSTPMAKEWDAQSLHAEPLGTTTPAIGTSDEYLRDLVQKRILTLTYIRNIHEGYVIETVIVLLLFLLVYRRSHWFHTIYISRTDLDRVFNNVEMKKRCVSERLPAVRCLVLITGPERRDFSSSECRLPICWTCRSLRTFCEDC